LFISFSGMPSRFLSEIPQEYIHIADAEENNNGYQDGIDPEPEEENYLSF